MGYLFKEVLKTLCGVNQWDYAVFWKIGCQNPNLLIWEECFYAPVAYNASWGSTQNHMLMHGVPPGNKACLLVDQMMMDKHVNIVGEGLVGRAAFTGNHQWILLDDFAKEPHPPEVVKEACQQFSADMQTVAVIPVLPHGVVQFGSHLAIMENMMFINEVKTLILQMGYAADGLLSDNYTAQETRVSNTFDFNPRNQLVHRLPKAEVIPSNPEIWLNQQASLNISRSILDQKPCRSSSVLNNGNFKWVDQEIMSVDGSQGCFSNRNFSTVSDMTYGQSSGTKHDIVENKFAKNELKALDHRSQYENPNFSELNSFFVQDNEFARENLLLKNTKYEDRCVKRQSGDDLFDILGVDFKNELFRSCWTSSSKDESDQNTNDTSKNDSFSIKTQNASSEIYPISQGNSDSDIFSMTESDHLLDAVVSKVHSSSLDDNVSCKTTLAYPSNSVIGVSDQMKEELFGVPKYMVKPETSNSCSFRSGCSKVESATISGNGSIYGSQISSWIEKGREIKPSSSVSTGYSKKADTTSKTTRKRLKPGENPRPRPKDRQMIQDRVKELREIVPNGAKCSIDALLERTIKHMLFLQSVTKHADKLKQTGESKIVNKDGGLLLRDNLEGGATWAYEVGSQSMVCPIIVEDLNQPRQMLVEMLCEERGLFLEIADMIRGMGLTILKGVMETRDNKIWARFSVEANRDVTRMEVFISLVRLLEQTAKNGVPLPKGINNETSTMVQQFHPLASIPVTGSSRSLQ